MKTEHPRHTHMFLSVVSVAHLGPSHAHACGPDPLPRFCSTPPTSTSTALPMTGSKRHDCATMLVGHLAECTPLAGYEPKTYSDSSSEHTPINHASRRNSFNTEYNDLTTTVGASQTPDMKEVGQSTPFCVSGFSAASGNQR